MVFTHLPANVFLMLTPFMPNLSLAVAMLLLRWSLSSMDVPARTAFVMSVVEPDERAAAASVTNVPRSLASAVKSGDRRADVEHDGFRLAFTGRRLPQGDL